MSFEDEKLEEAMKVLQETEKLCDTDAGVLKSIKNRFKSKKKREVMSICFPLLPTYPLHSRRSIRSTQDVATQLCSLLWPPLLPRLDPGSSVHFRWFFELFSLNTKFYTKY